MNPSELLRDLPHSWKTIPLKAVAAFRVSNVNKHSVDGEIPVRLCNYTDVYKNEFVCPDMDLMHATATPDEIERFRLKTGDVVITKDSESWDDIAVPAYVAGTAEDFVCGYHLAVIRPNPMIIDGKFLFRCLQARPIALQFELEAKGVTRFGLSLDGIGTAKIPIPTVAVQQRVVAYLDSEVARIDSLVSEKARLLTLLDEKELGFIDQIIVRGIDPKVRVKGNQSTWLKDIPAHWRNVRGKALFREVDQRSKSGEEALLSLRMAQGLVPHDDVSEKEMTTIDKVGYKKVMPGQLVINRMRAASGLIAVAGQPGLVSPDYAVFEVLDKSLNLGYYVELFKTTLLQSVFRSASKGLGTGEQGFLRLYSESFLSLYFPYPPVSEQHQIVGAIEGQRKEFDILRGILTQSIALAKQRRSALITAAVTGQIPLEEMTG